MLLGLTSFPTTTVLPPAEAARQAEDAGFASTNPQRLERVRSGAELAGLLP